MKFSKVAYLIEADLKQNILDRYHEWANKFESAGLLKDPFLKHLDWFGENLRSMQVEPTKDYIEKFKEVVAWIESFGRKRLPIKLEGKNWEKVIQIARIIPIE